MKSIHELTNNRKLLTIGDPHLGRTFTTNVPLAARGVREKQLADTYISMLNTEGMDFICMMGDLFDVFNVPNHVILFAWHGLMKAALANPKTMYIFNRGNHDESRNVELKSSWAVFKELADQAALPNIIIVGDTPLVIYEGIGVVPWHPFHSPKEMVDELATILMLDSHMPDKLEVILTHNDVSTYGSDHDPQNLMDFKGLARITNKVLNGHVHVPNTFEPIKDLVVHNTGSMMPLTFAEDKTGDMFVTFTLEEFQKLSEYDSLENKSVRILLKPDEVAPEAIKCLQFKTQRVNEKGTEEVGEVKPENFELKALYDIALSGVEEPLKSEIWESIKDKL